MEFTLLVSNGPVQVFKCKRAHVPRADESMIHELKPKDKKQQACKSEGGNPLHKKDVEVKKAKKKDANPGMKSTVDK